MAPNEQPDQLLTWIGAMATAKAALLKKVKPSKQQKEAIQARFGIDFSTNESNEQEVCAFSAWKLNQPEKRTAVKAFVAFWRAIFRIIVGYKPDEILLRMQKIAEKAMLTPGKNTPENPQGDYCAAVLYNFTHAAQQLKDLDPNVPEKALVMAATKQDASAMEKLMDLNANTSDALNQATANHDENAMRALMGFMGPRLNPTNALYTAACTNNTVGMDTLIRLGAKPEKALALAAVLKKPDVMQVLIAQMADPTEALVMTASESDTDAMQALIAQKADPTEALVMAASESDADAMQALMGLPTNPTDALYTAACTNNIVGMKALIRLGAKPNKALAMAAVLKNPDAMQVLIAQWADPTQALVMAATKQDASAMEKLMDLNANTSDALNQATANHDKNAMRALMGFMDSRLNQTNALYKAACTNNIVGMKALIRLGAKPEKALALAAVLKKPDAMLALIAQKADPTQTLANTLAMLLTTAQRDKITCEFMELRQQQSELSENEVNQALLLSAKYGCAESMQWCIVHDADTEAKNPKGETALVLYQAYCENKGEEPQNDIVARLTPPEAGSIMGGPR